MKLNLKNNFKNIFLLLFVAIFIAACNINPLEEENNIISKNESNLNIDSNLLSNQKDIIEITSQEELNKILIENNQNSNLNQNSFMARELVLKQSPSLDTMSSNKDSSSEYSQTNNQVSTVDEADIVKTDGTYIYTLSQNKIIVVKTENNKIIAEIQLEKSSDIVNFLIKENKIIIFSQEYISHFNIDEISLLPQEIFSQVTSLSIYENINEEFNLITSYSIEGNYNDARLIEDYIYLISNKYIYQNSNFPTVFKDSQPLSTSRTFILPNIPQEQFTIISSLNLKNLEEFNSNSYILDYSSSIYISKNNIYLISNNYNINQEQEQFKKIIYPLIKDKTNINIEEKKEDIFQKFNSYFSSLSEKEQKDLYENIQAKTEEFYFNQQKEQTSKINKFSINKGEINFETSTNVIGNLLNQFSLDEYQENLRVATTLSYWDRNSNEQYLENFVTIFDKNLNQISQINSIAIGERIFSARFEKETLYLVTFEQIDPFFVINLSDPSNPEILGELKLPGFSNYLQAYNSTHVIGIGRETKENQRGGFDIIGLKISLFDVTDKLNPVEISNFILEEKYAQSQSLYEHKSILLDSNKEILVIPIQQSSYDYNLGSVIENPFNGAFLFSLKDNKIEKKLEIKHEFTNNKNSWSNPNQILRSLYIKNNLYTISQTGIQVFDLDSFENLNEIDFKYQQREAINIEPYYR